MLNLSAPLLTNCGFLVLLIGFLCGAPLGSAINNHAAEPRIRAWRVAHSSLIGGGVMLLAIAPNLSRVALPPTLKLAASASLCLSTGSFAFALTFGAWKGYRGTQRDSGIGPAATYVANIAGVVLSTLSILLLAWGGGVHFLRMLLAA